MQSAPIRYLPLHELLAEHGVFNDRTTKADTSAAFCCGGNLEAHREEARRDGRPACSYGPVFRSG